jgi:hypothetical protein
MMMTGENNESCNLSLDTVAQMEAAASTSPRVCAAAAVALFVLIVQRCIKNWKRLLLPNPKRCFGTKGNARSSSVDLADSWIPGTTGDLPMAASKSVAGHLFNYFLDGGVKRVLNLEAF